MRFSEWERNARARIRFHEIGCALLILDLSRFLTPNRLGRLRRPRLIEAREARRGTSAENALKSENGKTAFAPSRRSPAPLIDNGAEVADPILRPRAVFDT